MTGRILTQSVSYVYGDQGKMKEAIGVLQHFSENERQYFLYQQRLEAECLRLTCERAVARAQNDVEQAKEMAKKATEEAIRQAEREKERLLALLKQAGVDPNPQEAAHDA